MIYVVTYELKSKDKDYAPLLSFLEKYQTSIHAMPNMWLISTPEEINLDSLCDEIRQLVESTDLVYIAQSDPNQTDGWMTTNVWNWLRRERGTSTERSSEV